MRKVISSLTLLAMLSACKFVARSEDQYRTDTRALLEAKAPEIQTCYDNQLQADPTLQGTVTVNFTIEKKTGTVLNPQADASSTAPQPLQECIVAAINGISLLPEDRREGQATFTWEFQPPAA